MVRTKEQLVSDAQPFSDKVIEYLPGRGGGPKLAYVSWTHYAQRMLLIHGGHRYSVTNMVAGSDGRYAVSVRVQFDDDEWYDGVGIDSEEVLIAAGTKWNFLPFRPGLVGGHCIGVDPYYLTYKAQQLGYHPQMILAGRRINDNMSLYVASQVIKLMLKKGIRPSGAKVLVLGLTFKENCPDVRNTKVVDIVKELSSYGASVDVHDPWCDAAEAKHEYDLDLVSTPLKGAYDGVVIAVAHNEFRALGAAGIRAFCKDTSVLYDIKYVLPADQVDDRL